MKRSVYILLLCCSPLISHAQADLHPTAVFPVDYLRPGMHDFELTVVNTGSTFVPTFGFKVGWQVDNGPITEATPSYPPYPVSVGANILTKVDGPFNAAFSTPGVHTLKVWTRVTSGTDGNVANDTIFKTVKVITDLPDKNVMMEVFKHQACCPCLPAAEFEAQFIDTMEHYSIANIYTGPTDVIYNADGDTVNSLFELAHPNSFYDRFKFAYAYELERGWYTLDNDYLLEDFKERERYMEPVEVKFASSIFDPTTRQLNVKLRAKFYDTLSGDLRFNLYITEDSVKAWQGCALPDPYEYYHMHVMRAFVGGPWGKQGSITGTQYPGSVKDYEFIYTIPADYKLDKLEMIGLVQQFKPDPTDRKIFNSTKISFEKSLTLAVEQVAPITRDDIVIFPNPADNELFLWTYGFKNTTVFTEVIDLHGRAVLRQMVKKGEAKLDISGLAAGLYFVRITDGSRIETVKFVKK